VLLLVGALAIPARRDPKIGHFLQMLQLPTAWLLFDGNCTYGTM
jgi:hypothetical protein